MKLLYDNAGSRLTLGKQIATGGEGAVYEINGQPELVAKIYHEEVLRTRGIALEAKLIALCAIRNDNLERVAAWPHTIIYDQARKVAGFTMRRITGYKDIHLLYGNKSRKVEFPGKGWDFLIRTATNLARAFEIIHQHDLVIGDVNHGSVLVNQEALVVLVDIDSIQIKEGGKVYTCNVGVPTHTPPELQGASLRGHLRSSNHDNFGLAVIIFQLLFLGRHPFAGTFLGTGEKSLETAIKEYRFAYGQNAAARGMKQPPFTPLLSTVTDTLSTAFENAFTSTGVRPFPYEWIAGLQSLERNLRKCSVNSGHTFFTGFARCPWCEIESSALVRLFDGILIIANTVGSFDLNAIWTAIQKVTLAPPDEGLSQGYKGVLTSLKPPIITTPRIQQFVKTASIYMVLAIVTVMASYFGILSYHATGYLNLFLLGIFVWMPVRTWQQAAAVISSELRKNEDEIKGHYDKARIGNGNRLFDEKKNSFVTLRHEYEQLPVTRMARLQKLEQEVKERQLHRYLDNFRLTASSITGIGPARTAVLRSYGIETAADIKYTTILNIPGFGPTYAHNLQAWRQAIERGFIFDSTRGVEPKDREEVEKDIAQRARQIESELSQAPTELQNFAAHIEFNRRVFQRKTAEFVASYATARGEEIALGRRGVLLLAPIVLCSGLTIFTTLKERGNDNPAGSLVASSPVATPSVIPGTLPLNQITVSKPTPSLSPASENTALAKTSATPVMAPTVLEKTVESKSEPQQKPPLLLPTDDTRAPSKDANTNPQPTPTASPAARRDFDTQARMNVAARLERLGHAVDWQKYSFLEMMDWEARINVANRLQRLGLEVDWQKCSFLQMSDWEARLNISKRLARKGLTVDWQKTTFLEMSDWEARMNVAERLKRKGIEVDWQNHSFLQLLEMERKNR